MRVALPTSNGPAGYRAIKRSGFQSLQRYLGRHDDFTRTLMLTGLGGLAEFNRDQISKRTYLYGPRCAPSGRSRLCCHEMLRATMQASAPG